MAIFSFNIYFISAIDYCGSRPQSTTYTSLKAQPDSMLISQIPTANPESGRYWRKSVAVVLLGFVALLANIDFEQNRYLHENFLGNSGTAETVPHADLALLVHKQLPLQRLLTLATVSNNDKDKEPPAWLSLADFNLQIFSFSAGTSPAISALVSYTSPRNRSYSPRAPPRF